MRRGTHRKINPRRKRRRIDDSRRADVAIHREAGATIVGHHRVGLAIPIQVPQRNPRLPALRRKIYRGANMESSSDLQRGDHTGHSAAGIAYDHRVFAGIGEQSHRNGQLAEVAPAPTHLERAIGN